MKSRTEQIKTLSEELFTSLFRSGRSLAEVEEIANNLISLKGSALKNELNTIGSLSSGILHF